MSQLFTYNAAPVRTYTENSETWFVAKDVCNALGIVWRSSTLSCIPVEWKGVRNFDTPSLGKRGGGVQKVMTISEPAVYKLAFRSNKPEADAFTNWVASEVLPAIRQGGAYAAEQPRRIEQPSLFDDAVVDATPPVQCAKTIDMLQDIQRRVASLKTACNFDARPGGRSFSLSADKLALYENMNECANMALASLNAVEFALRAASRIGDTVKFI